jgi:O-antigen/teichoic acid export membrane protein
MWEEIKGILRHSSVYGLAILLTNAMGVVLLPLYLNYLSPDDIGLLEIINRTNDILRIILMVGMVTTTLRFYQDRDESAYRKAVISTAMQFLFVFSLVVIGILLLFASRMSEIIFASAQHALYVRLMLLTIFFEVLYIVPILYFQARLQSTKYILISIARFIVGLSLIIYLVAYRGMGVMGVLVANIIYVGVFGSLLFMFILSKVGLRMDFTLLRRMIKFGLPFVPGSIFLFILNSGDRYILVHLKSADYVGIYAIGYRIGSLTTALVMSPFMRVWSALYVKYSQRENKNYLFSNFMTYVIFVYVLASLAIILFRHELLVLLGNAAYWRAADIVPFIAFAYLFWAASLILDSGFYITKKTGYKPVLFGIAAAIAVGLCFLMIPRYGYFGAVYATVISFAVYFLLSLAILKKIYPISYQWGRLVKIIITAAVIVAANEIFIGGRSVLSMISLDWKEWYGITAFKTALLIAFPIILYFIRFYNTEELSKFRYFAGILAPSAGRVREAEPVDKKAVTSKEID